MAETFVAVRHGPGGFVQTVCIKRILPAHEGDAEFVAAFLDEARTSAALCHANIVQVLDFGLADHSHYLALELVDGADLRTLFEPIRTRGGGLSSELVLLIALDLAAALVHAHGPDSRRPKVAHRDISLSNVLVSKAGEIKLTDFGIARAAYHTRRTRSGVLKGKVPYMPPEYILHNEFDARSDLYALGVLLYELLAGRRPFDGGSDFETARRITEGQYPRLPAPKGATEQTLHDCIVRLLSLAPDARFQSASALADALPELATHRARGRLAALVQQCAGAPEPSVTVGSQTPSRAATAPLERPLAPLSDARTEPYGKHDAPRPSTDSYAPTRTMARGPRTARKAPWRLAVLGVSGALIACALWWASGQIEPIANARRPVPRPPQLSLPPPIPRRSEPPTTPVDTAAPQQATLSVDAAAEPTEAMSPDASVLASADHAPAESPPSERPTKRVRVVVVPFGDVWLDDQPVGSAPIALRVAPGRHVLAIGDGHAQSRRSITVADADLFVTFRRSDDGSYRQTVR